MSDEEAWSVKASGLFVFGEFDRFDRKVADIRKNGRGDRFYRSSETGLELRPLNL